MKPEDLPALLKRVEQEASGSTKTLSVLALAASLIGKEFEDNPCLNRLSSRITEEMATKPVGAPILWIDGRLLLALFISKRESHSSVAEQLFSSLSEMKSEDPNELAYLTWAWGYLATYYAMAKEDHQYEHAMQTLQPMVEQRITEYCQDNNPDTYSVAMWSIAMAIQAAGCKQDHARYTKLMALFVAKDRLNKPSVADAICALRKGEEGDYPSWLSAIIFEASKKMAPADEVQALENVCKELQESKKLDNEDRLIGMATFSFSGQR